MNTSPAQFFGLLLIVLGTMMLTLLALPTVGFGGQVDESQYAGDVADVEADSGIVWKTTQVEIKTDAEATEGETFCVAPKHTDDILPPLRRAQSTGDRVTVTYERGYFEPVWRCAGETDGRRIVDVTVHRGETDAEGFLDDPLGRLVDVPTGGDQT